MTTITENPITAENLNAFMEFGCPIEVHADGTVTRSDVSLPESLTVYLDEDGQATDADAEATSDAASAGCELLTGYTGQHGCRGPIMHSSEFVGGRLAEDILSNAGVYVLLSVEGFSEDQEAESEAVGWAVAKKVSK